MVNYNKYLVDIISNENMINNISKIKDYNFNFIGYSNRYKIKPEIPDKNHILVNDYILIN